MRMALHRTGRCAPTLVVCIEPSMSDGAFASFQKHKYLNLETFRKNGAGVRTPVWFATESGAGVAGNVTSASEALYVYSTADSGKAKRIRNSSRARIAPCDMRGRLLGDWVEARAEIITGPEAERGMQLLNRKYKPWKQLLDLFASFRKPNRIMFAIRPAK
jgi:uncharacterized protein